MFNRNYSLPVKSNLCKFLKYSWLNTRVKWLHIRGLITKKILRLSYDVIITYDYRKLLSRRKIILRFFVISPQQYGGPSHREIR